MVVDVPLTQVSFTFYSSSFDVEDLKGELEMDTP